MSALEEIDGAIERRPLLRPSFSNAPAQGELPFETLRDSAGQCFRFEANLPRYLAGTSARPERPEDRRALLENLKDEGGRSSTHPELWVDFARSIGARWSARRPPPPRPAALGLWGTYEALTLGHGTPAQALGALYAYERQFPAVAAEKLPGLRVHYGSSTRRTHEFFRLPTTADVAHLAAEREILGQELRKEAPEDGGGTASVERTLGAWWAFLDSFGV